ncbi:type IV toxin-antitoxin system AbiEi family antitoxin domain-containing protein [Agreia bicolorata]|uniref:Transcriptional regulator, AbiEi antitoxin, Type IV TA system n=1 Tax=Agreia bicolorata TaxID=110935 RepID=A0ABR5CGZ9_9MICO|nr:hypothetical protein [Agreia bicolorata]KJC64938.1 hypothetical protein TZ00_04760 [Agreia bicolorata]
MDEHLRDPRTGLILTSSSSITPSEARQVRRQHRLGSSTRLHRGVYAESERIADLTPRARHLAQVHAIVETRRIRPIIGHLSAAVLWGMPIRPAMPTTVHVVVPPDSSIRSKNGVTVHRERLLEEDIVDVGGLLVTSPLRTLIDLARISPFVTAVTALDFALHDRRSTLFRPLAKAELLAGVTALDAVRGTSRALRAVEFSRAGADNAGETHSRIVIAELGFPAPELQVRHVNPRGGYYYVDFEWPEFRRIGEFDGKGKYLKPEYLDRMSPGDAVFEEKIREDHLRSDGHGVSRWIPGDVNKRGRLRGILLEAGLPCSR